MDNESAIGIWKILPHIGLGGSHDRHHPAGLGRNPRQSFSAIYLVARGNLPLYQHSEAQSYFIVLSTLNLWSPRSCNRDLVRQCHCGGLPQPSARNQRSHSLRRSRLDSDLVRSHILALSAMHIPSIENCLSSPVINGKISKIVALVFRPLLISGLYGRCFGDSMGSRIPHLYLSSSKSASMSALHNLDRCIWVVLIPPNWPSSCGNQTSFGSWWCSGDPPRSSSVSRTSLARCC